MAAISDESKSQSPAAPDPIFCNTSRTSASLWKSMSTATSLLNTNARVSVPSSAEPTWTMYRQVLASVFLRSVTSYCPLSLVWSWPICVPPLIWPSVTLSGPMRRSETETSRAGSTSAVSASARRTTLLARSRQAELFGSALANLPLGSRTCPATRGPPPPLGGILTSSSASPPQLASASSKARRPAVEALRGTQLGTITDPPNRRRHAAATTVERPASTWPRARCA